jgi:hypothetical protein
MTGFLSILCCWDFGRYDVKILTSAFGGIYSEFQSDWFVDVAHFLVEIYKIQMLFPIVEFMMRYITRHLKRSWDQSKCWPNEPDKTTCKTVPQFVETYLGPPFWIHYKYSLIMQLVTVPFLWGGLLPILFPLATLGLFIMYAVERLMVYYSYAHPPMLDERLTKMTVKTLYALPFIFCFITAWGFSN